MHEFSRRLVSENNLTVDDFIPLGIKELLTMQRQNGLGELIQRIIGLASANIHFQK